MESSSGIRDGRIKVAGIFLKLIGLSFILKLFICPTLVIENKRRGDGFDFPRRR